MSKSLVFVALCALLAAGAYYGLKKPESAGKSDDLKDVLSTPVEVKGAGNTSAGQKSDTPAVVRPKISSSGPWPDFFTQSSMFPFGRMQVNTTGSHVFVIRNDGDVPLELAADKPTCKCTKFQLSRTVVPPGEEATLEVHWKPIAVEEAFRHGGIIWTNDPDQPAVNFLVSGTVDAAVEILPNFWHIDSVRDGMPGTMEMTVGSRILESMSEPSVSSPSGLVRVTFQPLGVVELLDAEWKCGYKGFVEVDPAIPPGLFTEDVTVAFSELEKPMLVKLSARRYGRIAIKTMTPPLAFDEENMRLNFGPFQTSSGKEIQLLLIVDQTDLEEPFTATVIESDPLGLIATIEPMGNAGTKFGRYRLTVQYPPGRNRAQRTVATPGVIRLQTNLPTQEVLTLNVNMNAS